MNWFTLSLPLVISLSLLVASTVPPLLLEWSVKNIKVPKFEREEVDVTPVINAFSKVFGDEVEKLERTEGEITLVGTVTGSRRMALLRVNGKTLLLEEGERKKGILLKRVSRERAVVEVGGREVSLKLRRFLPEGPPEEIKTPGEFRISRKEIERITKDPGIMFREIRLVPYVKEGRTEGFLFEWIKPGSLFHRAGLRRGDVLVSINNIAIKSAEDAFRVLQVLRNEPSLRVVILRGGKRKEINVRID